MNFKSHISTVAVYAIFFLSGVAGLICEISWSRQIGLLLGHTVHAAAVVLSSYFSGMAVGYYIGGKYASRVSPLAAYAAAEFAIAVWTVLIPWLLFLTESTSLQLYVCHDSPVVQTVIRAVYCFLLLLPATISLGTTLPFMAEFVSPRSAFSVSRVSFVYAVNTLGAFVGVVSATLFLLANVGVRGSSFLAAGLSVLAATVAVLLSRQHLSVAGHDVVPEPVSAPIGKSETQRDVTWYCVFAGVCGFATLSLEVLYTRLFSLVFHNSTYTFGLVIAVFLVALAIGSAIVPVLNRRWSTDTLVGIGLALAAISVGTSVLVFVKITGLDYRPTGHSFGRYMLHGAFLVTVVVLPPVTFAGLLLPSLWRSLSGTSSAGRIVGRLTMINSMAASLGALLASFLLLPLVGLWMSFAVVVVLMGTSSFVWLVRCGRSTMAVSTGAVWLLVLLLLTVGAGLWVHPASTHAETLVRRWESAYGWIDVVTRNEGRVWSVRQNLHYRHGATGLKETSERRQAMIPLLLHENPRAVLFMGLGTGVTASGALPFEHVQTIDVVELIPEVVEAAELLAEFNAGIVQHPKVEIRIDDARHDLLASARTYDVIVSDLFVPWESQTGYLYTVEHYQTARKRLRDGGLFCQWLPLYQLGPNEFEMIANSFASVFPNTTLWWGRLEPQWPIIALIGCDQTLDLDAHGIEQRCAKLRRLPEYHLEPINSAARVVQRLAGGWAPPPGAMLNTDEYPRVEFMSPVAREDSLLLQGEFLENYFDSKLMRLKNADVNIVDHASDEVIARLMEFRRWQRFILFGDSPSLPSKQ